MFKLTRAKYLVAFQSAEEMQKALETEMENLENSSNILSSNWFGQQSEHNLKVINTSLQEGNHAKALAYTKGMTQVMEEYLPQIDRMMAKREQIGRQLYQDSYYMPDLSQFHEPELIIDYRCIDDVKADADGAVLYGEKAIEILKEMIDIAGSAGAGYVDLSGVRELLAEGKKELKRLENYRDEFTDFGNKMSDLEYNMSYDLAKIMREQGYTSSEYDPLEMMDIALKERAEQMKTLESMIRERGLTMEQYTSALLDCVMYLDFFDDEKKKPEDGYKYSNISEDITEGMTINELLEILGEYELYTEGSEDGKDTRHIFYQILQDAIELNPELGNYEITFMSRKFKETEPDTQYNEGTNGMVFTNPLTGTIYVAYRGTSEGEWGDDGERFNCLNVNDLTPQMEQTLQYFNYVAETMGWTEDMEIYVTGHSQGGNDAQISILLSEYGKYVDACYSFDGEGHSPELLDDVKKVLGEKEYNARVSRMYSICGEEDFVNHLGEKVIPEENTIYIKCNIEDFTKKHDIVSMFCDENMNYNGMINTGIGTGPSVYTIFTAKAWEELYELPPKARASCQAVVMNVAEIFTSRFSRFEGLNGEKARPDDWLGFALYGPEFIADSIYDTTKHYAVENVKNIVNHEVKQGMSEKQAVLTYAGVHMYVGMNELVTDYVQDKKNKVKRIWHTPVGYIKEKAKQTVNAIEDVIGENFDKIMENKALRESIFPSIKGLL